MEVPTPDPYAANLSSTPREPAASYTAGGALAALGAALLAATRGTPARLLASRCDASVAPEGLSRRLGPRSERGEPRL